jgi:hypothetical protein
MPVWLHKIILAQYFCIFAPVVEAGEHPNNFAGSHQFKGINGTTK